MTSFPGYPPGVVRPLMRPEGDGTSGLMIVGEAPGEHEEAEGLPFRPHAEAGSVLARALYRAGIPRESTTLTNLVWYRPPRNWLDGAPWERDAIRACERMNDALVERIRPRAILALGALAMRELTGLCGDKCGIGMTRGFVVPGTRWSGIPVVGTYHPSFLRRGSKEREERGPKGKTKSAGGGTAGGMALLGVLIRDLLLAHGIASSRIVPKFDYTHYELGATVEYWRDTLQFLRTRPDLLVSYDFETTESLAAEDESEMATTRLDVTQVQISWGIGHAIVSAWTNELRAVLRDILELSNPKIDWNGRKFDRPILRDMGIRTDLGVWHDGMDCLRADVKVRLFDGGSARISDIVNNRSVVSLLGMDEDGKQIPVSVTNWHRRDAPNQRWLKIKTDGTRFPIYATPEHEVFTYHGWKRADQVDPGDLLALPNRGCDDFLRGAIYGDGRYNQKHRTLMMQHSKNQEGWAAAKARYLGVKLHDGRTEDKHPIVYLSAICGRRWRRLYNPQGKRVFTPPNPKALAVWYLDDGNLSGNGRKGSNWLGRLRMPIGKFEDTWMVWKWFQTEFGSVTLSRDQQTATFGASAVQTFMERMAPWLHPSMEYKILPAFRGKYNGWMEQADPQWAEVTEVSVAARHGKRWDTRYCVSVDHPTERFFTEGGLVHNCWHHAQPDLARGLQFATSFACPEVGPWKHMNVSDPLWYGALDVDMPQRIWAWLRNTLGQTRHPVSGRSLWDGYVEQVVELAPVLDRMSARGIPVDEDARQRLDAEFTSTLERLSAEVQTLYPQQLKGRHPKSGWARTPADTSGMVWEDFTALTKCGCEWSKNVTQRKKLLSTRELEPCGACGNTGKITTTLKRWASVEPFLPGSPQQVMRYMEWARAQDVERIARRHSDRNAGKTWGECVAWADAHSEWKIPTDYKTGKPTTAADELTRLARRTGDGLLPKIVEYKEVEKMRGTYVRGWKPGPDGRVHPNFGFKPATGQLSSDNPNAQNFPAHGALAQTMKRMIVSAPFVSSVDQTKVGIAKAQEMAEAYDAAMRGGKLSSVDQARGGESV